MQGEWSRSIRQWEEMPHEEVPDVRTMTLSLIDEELLEDRKRSGSTTTLRLIDEELVEDRTSMEKHRRLLASFEGDGGSVWSKGQCGRIIEAAEALPELTATENQLYGRAPGTGHTSHILFETNPLQPYPFRFK